MSDFTLWFNLGIQHITDLQGYDHMLFLLVTTCVFVLRDFKKVLILISGFTVGHSITLAMSTLKFISVNANFIELSIAMTIFITTVYQIYQLKSKENKISLKFEFVIISIFGLIHGLGFSNMLKSMLGSEENIILPLLYFNLGIEVGQVLIVGMILIINTLIINNFKSYQTVYTGIIFMIILIISSYMVKNRFRIWTKHDILTTKIDQKPTIFAFYQTNNTIANFHNA